MALILCAECGKQISDKATQCIGCGAPVDLGAKSLSFAVPTSTSFDSSTGLFSGTMNLVIKLVVKAIIDIGWKVDNADEANGLVSFTTGMTWGSFSGVSGTIFAEEVSSGKFKVSGTAKQNIRGGQLLAPNLFNEANKKIQKIEARMKEMA